MLHEWLSPVPLEQFIPMHLGRAPYARPGAAARVVPWFDWGVLDAVLRSPPVPGDVLVARAGRLANALAPKNEAEARALMQSGLGIVIRRAERYDARLAELAQSFAEDLPGELHIQLYVTPAGTETFGWHFDSEHVFIAQTRGVKDYYFRQNTVLRDEPAETADFSLVRREKSPVLTSRLISGDWLYIPARWWHLVRSIEDALSISIGVVPRLRSPPVTLQHRACRS
jgi:50S ribosomal protein L16 3-hydroxylase